MMRTAITKELPKPRVRVRMLPGANVVGEDSETWFEGTEHDASESFARELTRRNKAIVIEPAPKRRKGR